MENYNLISQLIINDNSTEFFLFRFNNNQNEIEQQLFEYLKDIANKTKKCFKSLAPYENATLKKNTEYFILYHKPSNRVFGWTNVILSVNSNGTNYTYTVKIDKIVIISNFGGLKNIGTFMINYLLELYEKPCSFFNSYINNYETKIADYIYLYSLNTSIEFYGKLNGLVPLNKVYLSEDVPLSQNIFIKIPKVIDKQQSLIKKINRSMNDLHTFEIDEVDIPEDEIEVNDIPEECKNKTITMIENNKNEIETIITRLETIITRLEIRNTIIFENIDKINRKLRTTRAKTRSIIKK